MGSLQRLVVFLCYMLQVLMTLSAQVAGRGEEPPDAGNAHFAAEDAR